MDPIIYTTTKTKDIFQFKKIKINWYKNDIKIKFLDEGYATETFFAINCYKLDEETPIKDVYNVKETNEGTLKTLISGINILELNYSDFINWLTDQSSPTSLINSEDLIWEPLTGIELRLNKQIKFKKFPSVTGCDIIIKNLKWNSA